MKLQILIAALTLSRFTSVFAQGGPVDLTSGAWLVTGHDTVNYDGTSLIFTNQVPNASGFQVTGFFDWYSAGSYEGRELFSGTLSSNLHLHIEGYRVITPMNINPGVYDADV